MVVTDQDHVVLAQDGSSTGCGRVPQPRVRAAKGRVVLQELEELVLAGEWALLRPCRQR
jgi:hypothetical protein